MLAVDIKEKFFNLESGQKGFLTEITDIGKLVSIIVSNAMVIAGIILLFYMVFVGILISRPGNHRNPPKDHIKEKNDTGNDHRI